MTDIGAVKISGAGRDNEQEGRAREHDKWSRAISWCATSHLIPSLRRDERRSGEPHLVEDNRHSGIHRIRRIVLVDLPGEALRPVPSPPQEACQMVLRSPTARTHLAAGWLVALGASASSLHACARARMEDNRTGLLPPSAAAD